MGKFFLIIMIITLLIRSINFFKSIMQFLKESKSRLNKKSNNNPSDDNFSDGEIQDADFEEID